MLIEVTLKPLSLGIGELAVPLHGFSKLELSCDGLVSDGGQS